MQAKILTFQVLQFIHSLFTITLQMRKQFVVSMIFRNKAKYSEFSKKKLFVWIYLILYEKKNTKHKTAQEYTYINK